MGRQGRGGISHFVDFHAKVIKVGTGSPQIDELGSCSNLLTDPEGNNKPARGLEDRTNKLNPAEGRTSWQQSPLAVARRHTKLNHAALRKVAGHPIRDFGLGVPLQLNTERRHKGRESRHCAAKVRARFPSRKRQLGALTFAVSLLGSKTRPIPTAPVLKVAGTSCRGGRGGFTSMDRVGGFGLQLGFERGSWEGHGGASPAGPHRLFGQYVVTIVVVARARHVAL